MQALMMDSDEIEILDPSDLIPVSCELEDYSNRQGHSVPLVELGKQLRLSAQQGDVNNVRLLMGKGAPFTTDWLGTSPLHLAASNNHVELAEILLRAGISKDSRTKVERTPLHIASQEGHIELIRLLISYDANVNALDMLKMTPLHWAVERGHVQIIKLLLENGASVYTKNKFDKTVFDIAEDNHRLDIINILNTAASKKEEFNLECDTLTASNNLAMELGQVPAATKVEEVLTSPTTKFKEKSIHPKKHVKIKEEPKFNFISNHANILSNLQLLQAHGITMLPADNSNIVASAVENGQTVVLTEAGKLALKNLHFTQSSKSPSGAIIRKASTQTVHLPKKKFITIKTGDIITMSKTPNILKKEVPRNIPKVTKTTVAISEFEAISRQLAEARREAEEYKQLLSKKEKEAEQYKQQLESIVNSK